MPKSRVNQGRAWAGWAGLLRLKAPKAAFRGAADRNAALPCQPEQSAEPALEIFHLFERIPTNQPVHRLILPGGIGFAGGGSVPPTPAPSPGLSECQLTTPRSTCFSFRSGRSFRSSILGKDLLFLDMVSSSLVDFLQMFLPDKKQMDWNVSQRNAESF